MQKRGFIVEWKEAASAKRPVETQNECECGVVCAVRKLGWRPKESERFLIATV